MGQGCEMPEISRFRGLIIRMYYDAAWLILHEDELYQAWNLTVSNRRFDRIDPLR